MDKNQKHWLKNMVAWAEMKVSLEYPKAEYASFVEAVDALQIDLDNVDSQAARIAELEQALREILEGAQGNAGACINCDSIAQRAAAALK